MEDMNTSEQLPPQHEPTGDAQPRPLTDMPHRKVTRGQFLKSIATVAVGAALGKDVLGATRARAESSPEVSQVPVSIALPEIPPMSADAQQFTDAVGPNNNFAKVDQSSWSADQKAAYPQDELDTANWLDAIFMQAKNIADTTGNTQMFDTIMTLRNWERKYLVNSRAAIGIVDEPPWQYHAASDHPEQQYGVYTLHTGPTKNGRSIGMGLHIRSDARSKDYNAPNKTQALHSIMYFGEIIKIDRLNIDAVSDPFDANATSAFLTSNVSNVIIETEAYQRVFSAMRQIQPSFGQLGIVDNYTDKLKNVMQAFIGIDNDAALSDDTKVYQKRILVNSQLVDKPVPEQDLQKLNDPNNNGLLLN